MTHIPGNHGLLDLYGCDEAVLKDEGRLKTALKAAAQAAEATVLAEHFHTFGGAGLSYDRQTGEFTALQQHTQPIALVGEGLEVLWTRRALSRLGYEVLDTPDLLPRVTIEKGCWWLTTSTSSPRSAGSIGELLALLASSSPSSSSRP